MGGILCDGGAGEAAVPEVSRRAVPVVFITRTVLRLQITIPEGSEPVGSARRGKDAASRGAQLRGRRSPCHPWPPGQRDGGGGQGRGEPAGPGCGAR